MEKYSTSEKYVKGTVSMNEKSLSVIANMDIDMRWKYDNRIAVAGWGMVNWQFNQNFRINGGAINEVDDTPITIWKDGEIIGRRYISHNGNFFLPPNE